MPYQEISGSRSQKSWFLHTEEIEFLRNNNTLPNRVLFQKFNEHFNCQMSYSRMRHFQAQYQLQKQERGPAYTHFEKAFIRAHYESLSAIHLGMYLGRTKGSINKLISILKLKRSEEATRILRYYRSRNGAKILHEKIKKGEIKHPAIHLHSSFIRGNLKRTFGDIDIPDEMIELKRADLLLKRKINGISK